MQNSLTFNRGTSAIMNDMDTKPLWQLSSIAIEYIAEGSANKYGRTIPSEYT